VSHDLSLGAACMKGKVIPITQASIPVNEWGLVHSDINYDVVPKIEGAFFQSEDYLDHFMYSMESLRLNPHMARYEIAAALHSVVAQSRLSHSYVALVCSRWDSKVPVPH
jgi:branched-chain amino acid aminotransferase